MIAFEVTLNGKRVCTAGAEDLSVLNAIVNAVGPLGKKTVPVRPKEIPDLFYMVGGLTARADAKKDVHLRWKSVAPLKIGDVIQIRILDTTHADPPKFRKKAGRRNSKGANRK